MIPALRRPNARLSDRPRRRKLSGRTPVRAFERAPGQVVRRRTGPWLLSAIVAATLSLAEAGARDKHKDSVVGAVETYEARFDDTVLDVARRFGMGIEEMKLANPGVDLWLPGEGTAIRLPSRFVLPSGPRRGIVINVPEMRLYYYPQGRQPDSDLARRHRAARVRDPTWQDERHQEEGRSRLVPDRCDPGRVRGPGEDLPKVVLPGPDNPLGSHAIYLGLPTYLIHGTNRPYSIGMRVSFGCVRLYPEDIVELYDLVALGTPVRLVDERVKAGWLGDDLYLEVHPSPDLPARRRAPEHDRCGAPPSSR